MSRKLLYKEEFDQLFNNDNNKKQNIIAKAKKNKNSGGIGKSSKLNSEGKDSLFSEKFFKGHTGVVNDGLILPKLMLDKYF